MLWPAIVRLVTRIAPEQARNAQCRRENQVVRACGVVRQRVVSPTYGSLIAGFYSAACHGRENGATLTPCCHTQMRSHRLGGQAGSWCVRQKRQESVVNVVAGR